MHCRVKCHPSKLVTKPWALPKPCSPVLRHSRGQRFDSAIGRRRQKQVTGGLSCLLFFQLTSIYYISLRRAHPPLNYTGGGPYPPSHCRVLETWAHWGLCLIFYTLHLPRATAQPRFELYLVVQETAGALFVLGWKATGWPRGEWGRSQPEGLGWWWFHTAAPGQLGRKSSK